MHGEKEKEPLKQNMLPNTGGRKYPNW